MTAGGQLGGNSIGFLSHKQHILGLTPNSCICLHQVVICSNQSDHKNQECHFKGGRGCVRDFLRYYSKVDADPVVKSVLLVSFVIHKPDTEKYFAQLHTV